jgi:flagellar hook protein FlgE
MGLTSALNTSLNGLQLNETTIDVLGNNISNAGTNGFKASRTLFSTQLARTYSVGSKATDSNGGTNPRQAGLGALNAAIQVDFSQGGITNSTSPSDLAIQGDGFFVVNGQAGNIYTRNGSFSLNSESNLTNAQGLRLQGYGVNENFELNKNAITDIKIPLGDLQVAAATKNASIKGALFAAGDTATHGTLLTSAALTDNSTSAAITTGTLLTNVRNGAAIPFSNGQVLTLAPKKGGVDLQPETLTVTATSTVQDLLTCMNNTFGLQTGGTIPNDADGIAAGARVSGGVIQVKGNQGSTNDIDLPVGSLTDVNGTVDLGFGLATGTTRADGESKATTFVVYDSLGQAVNVRLTAVKESFNATSTTFRYFLDNEDAGNANTAVGSGQIIYDNNGNFSSSPGNTFAISRTNTAAVNPLQFTLDFGQTVGLSTPTAGSSLSLATQDGSSPGTLVGFTIDQQGLINGNFNNGIIKTLGQVVLARFSNPQGLLQAGGDTFTEGVGSGSPAVGSPGSFGAGTVRAGAIELSNTDVGRSLVDLIVASTNYRGNAKVISSIQQLVDELLTLGR